MNSTQQPSPCCTSKLIPSGVTRRFKKRRRSNYPRLSASIPLEPEAPQTAKTHYSDRAVNHAPGPLLAGWEWLKRREKAEEGKKSTAATNMERKIRPIIVDKASALGAPKVTRIRSLWISPTASRAQSYP